MYQALYRKYRPQTFDEVVGQLAVTQTLKNQVRSGRLSHAYLFTGTRGTGKTSSAKILAKAVNCENPQGGNPCNCCSACRSIDAGTCVDVLEIDAASNNGVDNVRSLRDEAVYTPAEVKRRVYIIDEVHMLSGAAFNALLKIMEEPPAHLLFILATTELHKVPATVLSRCQRFSFRRLTQEDIAARLNFVAYEENIDIDADAIGLLARLGDGALRDGLSLLDQCAAATEGAITADSVSSVLGLAGQRRTAELMSYVADRDAAAALDLFSTLYAGGKDISAMADELAALARDLLVLKTAPKSGQAMLSGIATSQESKALLDRFTGAELLRIVSLLQQMIGNSSRSANRRIDFELCLMQLCSPQLADDAQSLSARISRVEDTIASGVLPAAPAAQPKQAAHAANDDPPPWDDSDAPPEPDQPPVRQAPAKKAEAPAGFWTDLLAKVKAEYGPGFTFFSGALTGSVQDGVLTITASSEMIKMQFEREKLAELFKQKAAILLGSPVQVRVAVKGNAVGSADRYDELLRMGSQLGGIVDIR